MIRLLKQGKYSLTETFDHTKILMLDEYKKFAWVNATNIGDILVSTHRKFNPSATISTGTYRMYEVKDESKLTDLVHLELFVGNGRWQGYLLPTGLPTNSKKRNRVIATNEIITRSVV